MQKHFILSKKTPTVFSSKVAPLILENDKDIVFTACGNTIKVFSFRTGFCIKTIRSAKNGDAGTLQDIHKSEIQSMIIHRNSTTKELRLLSVCAKGTVAEWDPITFDLLAVYELAIGQGRIKICVMNKRYIATYQSINS